MPKATGTSRLEPALKLLDALADGVVVLDARREVLGFNAALEELTGLRRQEVLGRRAEDLGLLARVGEEAYPHGLAPPPKALSLPGDRFSRRLVLTRPDGLERWVHLRYRAVRAPGGRRLLLVGQIRDVTEETQWNRERDRARAPDSLGTLGFQLAHELLGPLNSIDIQAQLLTRLLSRLGEADTREADETVRLLRGEIRRLNAMLAETLQLRQPESRVRGLTDVSTLLRGLAELVRERAESQGVGLQVDLEESLPRLRVDAERLRHALLNLAMNALEAMPSGGTLRLLARRQDELVKLTVADSGPGLPRDVSGDAFQMFFTTKPGGTGMGLPLARSIVEEQGGSIRLVDSDQGAEFEVSLPVG